MTHVILKVCCRSEALCQDARQPMSTTELQYPSASCKLRLYRCILRQELHHVDRTLPQLEATLIEARNEVAARGRLLAVPIATSSALRLLSSLLLLCSSLDTLRGSTAAFEGKSLTSIVYLSSDTLVRDAAIASVPINQLARSTSVCASCSRCREPKRLSPVRTRSITLVP